jgi:hypothetical protein
MTEYIVTTHGGGAILMRRRPVRVVRGSTRYMARPCRDMAGLGEVSPQVLADKIDSLTSTVKEQMINTAAAQAAVNVALVIGLNAYPIVGNALSAMLALTQSLAARYNKNKMDDLMADLTNRLQALAASTKAEVTVAGLQVVKEETPAAALLALSGQSLSGVFDTIKDAWDWGRSTAGALTTKVATVGLKPVTAGFALPLALVGKGADAVGAGSVANIAGKASSALDTFSDKTADKAGQYVADPLAVGKDVQTLALTVTGYEAVKEADRKSGEVYAAAAAQMADAKTKALAELQTPAFRTELRKKIAQKMLDDPAFTTQAAAIDASNAAKKNAVASKFGLGAGIAAGVGSVVLLGLAAYFLFKKPSR